MRKRNSIIDALKAEGFEVYSIEELETNDSDDELVAEMEAVDATILISLPSMARYWLFKNVDTLEVYFRNDGLVGFDNAGELLESDAE